MFYMPGTKMLFGDAKDTCDGMKSLVSVTDEGDSLNFLSCPAIKRGLETKN